MADKNIIYANPTKDFFIEMLTKDIPLVRSIIDLVDNAVDGALRLRPNYDYKDLAVDIQFNETEFSIWDNCGGIPLDIAQRYAFRFGRPPDAEATPNSVGLFGVGMKRAIFKMGEYFVVESKTESHHFHVKQDIRVWRALNDWEFRFEEVVDDQQSLNEPGTRITVTRLHASIGEQFKLGNFLIALTSQLEAAQQISLERGLTIRINGKPLESRMLYLFQNDKIQPGFTTFNLEAYPKVNVTIYTGLFERDLGKGGWYLFCNSRLVLFADQSGDTGWDGSGGLPHYHPDFAYTRGYVYFSSSDASLLPWNTTKTGVDTDSPIFKAVKQKMIELMRPVTKWLRSSLAEEKKELGEEGELHQALKTVKTVSVSNLKLQQQIFSAPLFTKSDNPLTSVQYKMAPDRVETVRAKLGVRTNSDVGRETFDYFYKWECE